MASVRIGRVGRPHGLHGHLLVDECPLTPAELAALGNVTWRSNKGEERTVTILEAKPMMAKILVHFKGFDARVASSELVLGELMVEQDRLPDPGPGVAYAFQLIGMTVETVEQRQLGALESIVQTGANPIYIVQGEREWLIPATADVVKNVDFAKRVITVALPVGLEEI